MRLLGCLTKLGINTKRHDLNDFGKNRQLLVKALMTNVSFDPKAFLSALDEENNEYEVRERLSLGRYNSRMAKLAEEWLRRKEDSRQAELLSRSQSREEESLLIAKRALSVASEANRIASSARDSAMAQARWAMWATIIAIIAAIIAIKDEILKLIFGTS